MNKKIEQVIVDIWQMSSRARCQPVDRYSVFPLLSAINKFNHVEKLTFIVEASNYYNNKNFFPRLMTCLPEVWEDISYEDVLQMISQVKGNVSLMSIVEFFYKYLEIDIFDIVLHDEHLSIEQKKHLISYYADRFSFLLRDDNVDKRWYSEKIMGITLEPMMLLKERFLKDHRFVEALTDPTEMKPYFAEKYRVYLNNINKR